MSTFPFISQLKSLWQAVTGDTAGARKTQEEFLDAWVHHPGQQISDFADNIPVVGHIKGLVHLALGDTEAFAHSEEAATRTLAVIGAGALTAGTGGAAAPILAGVVAGVAADAALTGIESARHHKYDPQGYLGAISEFGTDWRGGTFDIIALGVGDGFIGREGSIEKAKTKSTKVYRVEGEGNYLTDAENVEYGHSSRIFPGPGGRVIDSQNVVKFIIDESKDPEPKLPKPPKPPKPGQPPKPKPKTKVKFKKPATLYLNVGDAARSEAYYAQKLLQYRDAVEKLKTEPEPSTSTVSHPTAFQFKIKTFRVLKSDVDNMFRDVPHDGSPSPRGVRRVDITKTSKSFQCPQPVYTPLIERAIPGSYAESRPAWLTHLPTRLLQAMEDHQVAYGRVRTCVIAASKFGKLSLISNVSQRITDGELKRLEHGSISLSNLSDQGVRDIQIREEPVRRLRQSREVKCGRSLAKDVDHGRWMEYLAEFSDGSTSWIPSYNVALDLKKEFWTNVTTNAKEISEIASSDPSTGQVRIKYPDGSIQMINQTNIFWHEEDEAPMLTDAEVEALLFHGHFGNDIKDFMPCMLEVNSDWAKLDAASTGIAFMKDPAADKAGEYADLWFDAKSIQVGRSRSHNFASRRIPFFVANNGAKFDIKVTHGRDRARLGDFKGDVSLDVPGHHVESKLNFSDPDTNPRTFHIAPIIVTPALMSVETDWGSIEINSKGATVQPDSTADQTAYQGVTFGPTSIKLDTGAFGQKRVIPFVLLTHEETVDITIKHGRDKTYDQDNLGQTSALFGHNTYTSGYNPRDVSYNAKSFKRCKVNVRPFAAPMEVVT